MKIKVGVPVKKTEAFFIQIMGLFHGTKKKISDIADIYDIYIDKNEFGWAVGKDYFSELPILFKYNPDAK